MTAPKALDLLIAAAAALQALTAVGVPAALAVLTQALMALPEAEPYVGPLEIGDDELRAYSTEEIDFGLEPPTYSTEELMIS
jgi:hypothetical protein